MSQIDDFLKMLDEEDYSRALKKEKTKKAVKASTAKTEDELLQEEVVKTKRRKKAKELTTPPPTKQEALAKKVKEMQDQDKYNELIGKGKPEEGADAVDRLLDAYAEAQGRVYDKDDEVKPEFSAGVIPEKETIKGRRSIPLPGTDRVIPIPFMKKEFEVDNPGYDPKGKKGSAYRIAKERIEDVAGDLKLAQIAKEQGITLQEAKRNKQIEDKYNEYLKKFNVPSSGTYRGKDGEFPEKQIIADKDKIEAKRRYLARMQTQNFFSK
tara:strand:+ start:722 stop:1522 length:801 start_codon:yes stop_codon:yes gene_type:complete